MPKKNRSKLTLKPDALAWLATNCPADVWLRVLQLFDRKQYAALFSYLQQTTSPEVYRQFEERNLEPEILTERRKAEAAKQKTIENEQKTMGTGLTGLPPIGSLDAVMGGGTWKPLILTKDREAAEEAAEEARRHHNLEHYEILIPEEKW
jgi:hypothetical protein